MVYRETREQRFLNQAVHIANFILNHKNFPAEMVPYWDFDVPNIDKEPRDASAAAIICSALYELSTHLGREGVNYESAADKLLKSLSSERYLAKPGENANFLLRHAVGNKPANSEIDIPLIYADYYFLEANLRKLKIERMADGMSGYVPKGQHENSPEILSLGSKINLQTKVPQGPIEKDNRDYLRRAVFIRPYGTREVFMDHASHQ